MKRKKEIVIKNSSGERTRPAAKTKEKYAEFVNSPSKNLVGILNKNAITLNIDKYKLNTINLVNVLFILLTCLKNPIPSKSSPDNIITHCTASKVSAIKFNSVSILGLRKVTTAILLLKLFNMSNEYFLPSLVRPAVGE